MLFFFCPTPEASPQNGSADGSTIIFSPALIHLKVGRLAASVFLEVNKTYVTSWRRGERINLISYSESIAFVAGVSKKVGLNEETKIMWIDDEQLNLFLLKKGKVIYDVIEKSYSLNYRCYKFPLDQFKKKTGRRIVISRRSRKNVFFHLSPIQCRKVQVNSVI